MEKNEIKKLAEQLTALPGIELSKSLRAAYKILSMDECDILDRIITDIQCDQREAGYAKEKSNA